MEGVLKMIQLTYKGVKKSQKDIPLEHNDLLNQIREVCLQMHYNDKWFQSEIDNDLIDACIYQHEVLNAKYKYLIKKARNENIAIPSFKNSTKRKEETI